jgi:hypothetical protein
MDGVNACRHLRFAYPKILPLAYIYCTMRVRRSKRIVAGSLACNHRMSRSTPNFSWKPQSANEHAKAERIFSNVKNIAFRPNVQAGS